MRLRLHHPRAAAIGVAAGAVVLAGGGIALAEIPSGSGTITGCYLKSAGNLRVIDHEGGERCRKHETELTWEQQGQPGPPGPQGPQGAQGVQGPVGSVGEVTVIWSDPATIPSNFRTSVSATCPAGTRAIGGGFQTINVRTPGSRIDQSHMVGDDTWRVGVNFDPSSGEVEVRAQVLCVDR